jgi:hypothetical protein
MAEASALTEQVIQVLQQAHAIRIEELAWACPNSTWNQILATVKQLSQTRQLKLICSRHGGLIVMLPMLKRGELSGSLSTSYYVGA